jgi:hypothetical protein
MVYLGILCFAFAFVKIYFLNFLYFLLSIPKFIVNMKYFVLFLFYFIKKDIIFKIL